MLGDNPEFSYEGYIVLSKRERFNSTNIYTLLHVARKINN